MPFANRASFLFAPQDATAFSTKSKTWSRSSLSRVKVLVRSPSSENSRIPRETETDLASLKSTVVQNIEDSAGQPHGADEGVLNPLCQKPLFPLLNVGPGSFFNVEKRVMKDFLVYGAGFGPAVACYEGDAVLSFFYGYKAGIVVDGFLDVACDKFYPVVIDSQFSGF